MSPFGFAFAAGALACIGLADLFAGALRDWIRRGRGRDGLRSVVESFATAGNEGRDPDRVERVRVLAVLALVGAAGGWLIGGVAAGLAGGVLAPFGGGRLLRARRERYRRAVDAGAGQIAIALADALAGGHSLRGAIAVAARSLHGPSGRELARVAGELELGAPTDAALQALRRRVGAGAVDVIVAGALLQRSAGGDLVRMLRSAARAMEDEQRLLGDVRAATAQARFTGLVVVLLPLGGALLAELARPGFAIRLMTSPLSLWLIAMALAMQAAAAFAIHRLARMRV